MKYTSLALLASAMMLAASCTPDRSADREVLEAFTPRWMAAEKEGDAAAIASLFAEDGTWYRLGRAPLVGPTAVESHLAEVFASGPIDQTAATERLDIAASGDLAVEQGAWLAANGNEGRYVTAFSKIGGEWKISADISINTTPNGGAPDWAVELLATWQRLRDAHDAAGLAGLYTVDARVGSVVGRAAVEASFESNWGPDAMTCSGTYSGFREIRDMAIGWGVDVCVTPGAGGESDSVERFAWICFFERQADGTWLISRDISEPLGA